MGCYYNNIKQNNTHPIGTGSLEWINLSTYLSIYLQFLCVFHWHPFVRSFHGGNQSWIALSDVCMAYPLIELSKKLCGICIRRDLIRRMLYNIVVRSTIITQFCMWQIVLNFRFSSALLVVVVGLVHYLKKPHAICFTLPSPPPPPPPPRGTRTLCLSFWLIFGILMENLKS
jgi:hypothetical protein